MANVAANTTENLTTISQLTRTLPKFEGDPAAFAEWKETIIIEARSAYSGLWAKIGELLGGAERPQALNPRQILWDK